MLTCLRCQRAFGGYVKVDGKLRNLKNRRYCLECSPFKSGNHRQLHKARPTCRQCGKVVNAKCVYCSNACQWEHRFRAYVGRWLAGEETGRYANRATSLLVRRYLVETRGERCELCGWNERHAVTGSVPVTVHHIDGDSDNNRPENLQLLCPNHHSLTATYGNLNKGNGKRNRRN